MGFRFRKSINLGGGVRINLSKKGIGYSIGTKGYRVTKTSRGTVRKTASIPGTGISHVTETSTKSRAKKAKAVGSQVHDSQNQITAKVNQVTSEKYNDLMLRATGILGAKRVLPWCMLVTLYLYGISKYFMILLLAELVFYALLLLKARAVLENVEEEEWDSDAADRMSKLSGIAHSQKHWYMTDGGARFDCKLVNKLPFPLKSNASFYAFKVGKDYMIFLPKMIVIKSGRRFGIVDYFDAEILFDEVKFLESGKVPGDAEVVGKGWLHETKNGDPDLRYSDNPQYPICKYGRVSVKTEGLDAALIFSNPTAI